MIDYVIRENQVSTRTFLLGFLDGAIKVLLFLAVLIMAAGIIYALG